MLSTAVKMTVYKGFLDAANGKIKQLESAVGELKRKVSGLVDELSNIEFWHRQELDEVKSESMEVRRENLMLKREQKGLMNLLRRHGIDPAKEKESTNRNMARDKEHNMTYNDLGRWANMRFEFIKQHRPQLYQKPTERKNKRTATW